MVGQYKVITLCGSTRFKDAFLREQKRLTLEGNIVISVGLFGHSGDNEVWEGMPENAVTETKAMLDDMHKRKIDMADEIFVINENGYIGDSTKSEIAYAMSTGKPVIYLNPAEDPRDIGEPSDFSCWVIRYGRMSIAGKKYQKDSLKNNAGIHVPLLWNHQHNDIASVLGHALLEGRDDGIYAYCKLSDAPINGMTIQLIQNIGSVSLSPYIANVKTDGNFITHGNIREVSLVRARVDPDESYYPIMRSEKEKHK